MSVVCENSACSVENITKPVVLLLALSTESPGKLESPTDNSEQFSEPGGIYILEPFEELESSFRTSSMVRFRENILNICGFAWFI